jgi:hypothetical protein
MDTAQIPRSIKKTIHLGVYDFGNRIISISQILFSKNN